MIPAYTTKMRYPESTPMQFSGAKEFVETHGNAVWAEFCDEFHTNVLINTTSAAGKLESLKGYAKPERYLKAVLKAIEADYNERPAEYEGRKPFTIVGKTMKLIIL